jgi:hypothetical protein
MNAFPPRPVLSWQLPAQVFLLVAVVLGPACVWLGAARPDLLGDFSSLWQSPTLDAISAALIAALLLLPLLWVLSSRVMDLLACVLAQNALLMLGVFFLDITAYRLHGEGPSILRAAPLVVFLNAGGFGILFLSLGATYLLTALSRARLHPIHAPPEDYDARLRGLLLAVGLVAGAVIALPMVVSGTIPLLAADPVAARFQLVQSDAARALYHMGTALLPFVVGGLLAGLVRRPARLLALDGWLALGIVALQVLTSNRLPLAISLLVTVTLLTLERRWPRWLLVLGFFGYLFIYAGLSGFTAILRQDRAALDRGSALKASIEEAFLGDNFIDLRDAAWVFSHWDGQPLLGRTYLGGLVSMVPSGVFPQKKQWHLGLTGVRIVGWDTEEHFGLRITFFGEAFLNFGWPGVIALAVVLGCAFGVLLRMLHLAAGKSPPCLAKNLKIVLLMQMLLPLANTSDAFTSWAMLALLVAMWLWVEHPLSLAARRNPRALPAHA